MKTKNSIKQLPYKVVFCLFAFIQLILLINIYAHSDSTNYFCKRTFLFPNRVNLFLSLAFCFLISLIFYKFHIIGKNLKNIPLLLFFGSIIILIFQLTTTFYVFFYTGWDPGIIRTTVFKIFNDQSLLNTDFNFRLYFSRYPNNINLVAIFILISNVFSIFNINSYFGLLIINNLLINIAGIFTFLASYKMHHKVMYAALSWVLFSLLISLSPWITIPYSDTYSILFPILCFYLYITRKAQKLSYGRWFAIGFLGFLGYTIKPTAIIVLVIIIVIEFLKVICKSNKPIVLNKLIPLSMIVISVIPVLIFSMFSKNILGLELDKNQKFSLFHFAMMGLNDERQGVYFDDDVRFSSTFNTTEERNSANITIIKDRLSVFGIYGYLSYLGKKALVNFSDGSFAWGCEGNFYAEIPEREGFISTLLENIYYRGGKFHNIYLTIVQLLWFLVLILLFGLTIKINKDYKMIVLLLTIILIFSFVMVFESRARYLFIYSPFFMIGAGFGAYNIGIYLNSLIGSKQ